MCAVRSGAPRTSYIIDRPKITEHCMKKLPHDKYGSFFVYKYYAAPRKNQFERTGVPPK